MKVNAMLYREKVIAIKLVRICESTSSYVAAVKQSWKHYRDTTVAIYMLEKGLK